MKRMDLNCDMGEGIGNDEALMPFISSANIACGYHAGDTDTIRRTIEMCVANNVAIGVHPSFFDTDNFGRHPVHLGDEALYKLIREQLEIFFSLAREINAPVHHVKPHGALYNMAATDGHMAGIIAKAIHDFDCSLVLYGLAGSKLLESGGKSGLKTAAEAFVDRRYQPDGSLVPRSRPDAVIANQEDSLQQLVELVDRGQVISTDGTRVSVAADTICIHGDHQGATSLASAIHSALAAKGIELSTV